MGGHRAGACVDFPRGLRVGGGCVCCACGGVSGVLCVVVLWVLCVVCCVVCVCAVWPVVVLCVFVGFDPGDGDLNHTKVASFHRHYYYIYLGLSVVVIISDYTRAIPVSKTIKLRLLPFIESDATTPPPILYDAAVPF